MYGSIDAKDPESMSVIGESKKPEKKAVVILRVTFVTASLVVLSLLASIFTHHQNSKFSDSHATLIERTTYSSLSDVEKEALFTTFMTTYSRSYDSDDEYQYRLSTFKSNLDLADERNAAESLANGGAVHGVSKFMDLTPDEFESKYLIGSYDSSYAYTGTVRRLSAVVGKDEAREIYKRALKIVKPVTGGDSTTTDTIIDTSATDQTTTSTSVSGGQDVGVNINVGVDVGVDVGTDVSVSFVDWTDVYTTPVYDQGDGCSGSSWAFSTIMQIESDAIRKGVISISDSLSVQQMLSCNYNSSGCAGGSVESGYSFAKRPGAVHFASTYPYTASGDVAGDCTDSGSGYALTLGSYATVTKYHNEPPTAQYTTTQVEANMLAHLVATGTLHACLDASTWSTYVSGTMSSCTGSSINQCVQVVGVYYDPVESTGYYKIRNSWGTDWGESGFITLSHGINACDISFNPGYTDPVDCC